MHRYLFILLLFITQTIASNELTEIKIKAKQKGDVVNVKAIIKSPMFSPYQAERQKGDRNKADFITHILAKVGANVVFDVTTGPDLSKNPFIQFKYGYEGGGDTLELIVKDNNGRESKTKTKIKSSLGENSSLQSKTTRYKVTDYATQDSKVWKLTSVNAILDEMYGSHTVLTDSRFQVFTPNWPSNRGAVPVSIKGTLALESFVIFATNNPQVTVAVATITPQSILDYTFKVKVKEGGEVIVIAKGRDGKLYKASNEAALSVTIEAMKEKCVKGNSKACNGLASAYIFGRDARGFKVEEDEIKAEHYWSIAADLYAKACVRNDYKQCYELALCYEQGRGREENLSKALFYFEKACNGGGDADSCRRMAQLYPYKSLKSREMYMKACELGSARDCFDGARSFSVNNISKRKELYQKACDLASVGGCQEVAILYLDENTETGNKKAMKALRKACFMGSKRECFKVGQIYEIGKIGVTKNITKAKEFYQKACSNYLPEACAKLGTEPISFSPKPYKDVKSKRTFEAQCNNNDYWACYRLGDMYHRGQGVTKNLDLAKKYYTKSCSGDYYESCFNLAHLYRHEKNYKQALPLYLKVCEHGSYYGCSSLGRFYFDNKDGHGNLSLALKFYEKACARGDSVACIVEVDRIKKMMLKKMLKDKER